MAQQFFGSAAAAGEHSTGWGDGDDDSLEQLLLDPDLHVMDIEGALDALGAPSPKAQRAPAAERPRAAERARAGRLETLADVRAAARNRWLTNDEVLEVLTHARGRFGMPVQEKPAQQPPSGSLWLYSKATTRKRAESDDDPSLMRK